VKWLIPRSVHESLAKSEPYKPYRFINGVAVSTTDVGERSFVGTFSYRQKAFRRRTKPAKSKVQDRTCSRP